MEQVREYVNASSGGEMQGKNWNSKTGEWSDIVRPETKENAALAQEMRKAGDSIAKIAKALGKSESRIREYLRK
jgi:hypothetical protein